MKKLILSLVAALTLSVTPAFAASAPSFNVTDLIRASDADLTAAIVDATAHNDAFATQCYQGILDYNKANPQTNILPTKPVGVVSAFQLGRDVVKGVQSPVNIVPKEIVLACGPLALDIQGDVLKAVPASAGLFGIFH